MSVIGLYVAGTSPVHRLSPRTKLLGLVLLEAAIVVAARSPATIAAAAVVTAGLYATAGLAPRVVWTTLRGVVLLAVVVGVAQAFVVGPERAAVVAGQLLLCVAVATLVTLSTRTSELLDALESWLAPLRRVRVDPARVALALALAIRSVPVVVGLVDEVRQAHRARGARLTPSTLAIPVVVRTLIHAHGVGEALVARGVDD